MLKPDDGDWGKILFRQCLDWVSERCGEPPNKLRPLFGRWLKACGDDRRRLVQIIGEAQRDDRSDVKSWVQAVVDGRGQQSRPSGFDPHVEKLVKQYGGEGPARANNPPVDEKPKAPEEITPKPKETGAESGSTGREGIGVDENTGKSRNSANQPSDRKDLASSTTEGDLLEIPGFLRRQAT